MNQVTDKLPEKVSVNISPAKTPIRKFLEIFQAKNTRLTEEIILIAFFLLNKLLFP